MASTPTKIWTALPNGLMTTAAGGDQPLLSIYVSLRLDDPASSSLADYTLGNWPAVLAMLVNQQQVRIELGDSASPPAITVMPATFDISLLSPALWDALFPSSARVTPFAFQDHSQRAIRSYSVQAIHDYIESVYTSVANDSAEDFPDLTLSNDASNLVGAISSVMVEVRRQATATGAASQGHIPPLPPNLASGSPGPHPDANIEAQMEARAQAVAAGIPGAELYRAYRFYNRGQQEPYRSNTLPRAVADIPPPPEVPKFDFHQVVAALGDHPAILRRLGLILDCTLARALPAGSTFDRVRVAIGDPAGGPPSPSDKSPWTLLEPSTFRTRPKATTDTTGQFLALGNAGLFGVTQSDVDGAALRTIDYGVNMAGLLAAIVKQNQPVCEPAGVLVPAKPRQAQLQSLPALRTTGIHVFRIARDEALYEQLTVAASNNGDPGAAVLSLEDVTRGYRVDVGAGSAWYSLCARIPSYSIGTMTITPGQDEGYVKAASGTSTVKDPPSGPAVKDLYLHETLFGWDNWSLVVARPGRSISFDRDDTERTQTEVVRREENAPNPDFPLQIRASVPSKSLPPLRFGRQYLLRARVVDLAGNSLPLSALAAPGASTARITYQRYEPVAPPVLVLRAPVTAGESVERLVIRTKVGEDPIDDESTIFNATCQRHVAPPKTSQLTAELHGAFDGLFPDAAAVYAVAVKEKGTWQDPGGDVELINASGESVDASPLELRGEPLPKDHYTIHTSDSPALPYLPDPLAAGAVLQVPGGFVSLDYDVGSGGWPDLSTFLLTLQASADASEAFDADGGFNVSLPRGTITTLRYSSTIAEANLPLMARWNAMSAAGRGNAAAIENQHWMLTPYRELAFVHAVEKPLEPPRVEPLMVARNLGEPFVTLTGAISNHSPSTGRLELLAAWSETVDRLSESGPTTEDRSGRVFERDVAYDETSLVIPPPCEVVRHELGDTKHRWIKYHALATTRYREHFPTLAGRPDLITLAGAETEAINIPNAARPDVPRVLYVIPTFEWSLSDDKTKSTRTGRGLRIYVDRTWYSSGDDELLGVILPQAGDDVPEALQKYVSQWGSDPIWDTSGPDAALTPDDFIYDMSDPDAAPTVQTGLTLAEVDPSQSDLLVTAVGIAPQYNEDRQLYFFDLVLDPGDSYYPFVRLVLARFQPYSLADAHLSRTVRADFAQLVADRTAAITYHDTSVDVSVSGLMPTSNVEAETHEPPSSEPVRRAKDSYVKSRDAGRGRLVSAYVEQRKSKKLGDLGWEPVGSVVSLQPYKLGKTPNIVYFRGSVPLPSSFGDSAEYRLCVEEREIFETDSAVQESDLPIDAPSEVPYRTRLVYFDALPLEK